MHWVYTPYILPLAVSAVLSIVLATLMWQRRTTPGATSFFVILTATAFWSITYLLEIGSTILPEKIFWANLEYIGVVALPVAWVTFALEYSNHERLLTRRNLALLMLVPVLTLILAGLNSPLLRSEFYVDPRGPFPVLQSVYGPWFWLYTIYSYSLLFIGSFYLIQTLSTTSRWYASQIAIVLVAVLLPWLANIVYILRVFPSFPLDPTPIAFSLTGILVTWGIFRFRFMNITPVARTVVLENFTDGVVVLNNQNRIVDANLAAGGMVGEPADKMIGKWMENVLAAYPDIVERYLNVYQAQGEIVMGNGSERRYIDLKISPLYNRGRLSGRVMVLRDVTEHKKAELEVQQSSELLVATLDATADGILVVDEQGEIVRMNRRLVEMLKLPPTMLQGASERPALDSFVQQLVHPDTFYMLMDKLNAYPEAESYDVLELKDGRVFERYSRPQRIGEKRVGRVWSFHDITEQRRAEEDLRYMSSHDILTGLYNRGYFEEELNRLEGSRLFPVSLIIADVDGLKDTNDTQGHSAGDRLLRHAAEILRNACRAEDVVARIGGDEFCIVLPEADASAAEGVLERIQNMLAIRRVGETEIPLSLSLGAATAEDSQKLRRVLRMADNAMYQVKRAKRGKRSTTDRLEM